MDSISVGISQHPPQKGITLLKVKGYMDSTNFSEFEKSLQSVLRAEKFKLVVDLTEVDYISSAGWGVFVSELKMIRRQSGDLLLVGMNPHVAEVFELLEFDSILKSYPDVESAVQEGFKLKISPAKRIAASHFRN